VLPGGLKKIRKKKKRLLEDSVLSGSAVFTGTGATQISSSDQPCSLKKEYLKTKFIL
jgi:hypothetical protein